MTLIEEFIPEGVMMSNRAYYLILVKASCEYLINMQIKDDEMIEEEEEKDDDQNDLP